jgi:hypothetical protein
MHFFGYPAPPSTCGIISDEAQMALFRLHNDFAATTGGSRVTLARASGWLVAILKMIHESIVAAKTRRLQRELMFHADMGEGAFGERDIRRIPQPPMILGDKWNF